MDQTYSARALQSATGVSVRTIHDWVRRKLLPKPNGRGRAAHYDSRHVTAVRVVRQLQAQGLSLKEIRKRTAELPDSELQALLSAPSESRGKAAMISGAAGGVPDSDARLGRTGPTANVAIGGRAVKAMAVYELMDGLMLMVNLERGELVRRVAESICQNYAGSQRE